MDASNIDEVVLSRQELWKQADALAQQELGVDAHEAFARLERGEFDGTILESKLSAIAYLLGIGFEPIAAE